MKNFKNRKFVLISLVLLFSLFVLSACSSSTQSSNQTPSSGNQSNNGQAGSSPRGRMPDYGQPKRQADIRGVVKSITGNEVSILKMDINTGGRRASSTDNASTTSDNTKNTPAVSLTGTGAGGQAGGRRAGGFGGPGGGGPGGQSDPASRAAMLEQLKKLSTGEEKVIIPVGIQMLKSSINTDTQKREMVEASLTDITADKMITIWLNSSVTDKKVAEFVFIN